MRSPAQWGWWTLTEQNMSNFKKWFERTNFPPALMENDHVAPAWGPGRHIHLSDACCSVLLQPDGQHTPHMIPQQCRQQSVWENINRHKAVPGTFWKRWHTATMFQKWCDMFHSTFDSNFDSTLDGTKVWRAVWRCTTKVHHEGCEVWISSTLSEFSLVASKLASLEWCATVPKFFSDCTVTGYIKVASCCTPTLQQHNEWKHAHCTAKCHQGAINPSASVSELPWQPTMVSQLWTFMPTWMPDQFWKLACPTYFADPQPHDAGGFVTGGKACGEMQAAPWAWTWSEDHLCHMAGKQCCGSHVSVFKIS